MTCSTADSTFKRPTQGRSFNHSAGTTDVIGHRPLVQDHSYIPEVGGSSQQPQGFSENIRPAVHHCMTLWALGSEAVAHERAYGL
jgi:hypothetical protein